MKISFYCNCWKVLHYRYHQVDIIPISFFKGLCRKLAFQTAVSPECDGHSTWTAALLDGSATLTPQNDFCMFATKNIKDKKLPSKWLPGRKHLILFETGVAAVLVPSERSTSSPFALINMAPWLPVYPTRPSPRGLVGYPSSHPMLALLLSRQPMNKLSTWATPLLSITSWF